LHFVQDASKAEGQNTEAHGKDAQNFVDRTFRSSEHSEAKEDLEQTGDYKEDNHLNILSIRVLLEDSPTFQGWLISAACPTPLLFRFLVALPPGETSYFAPNICSSPPLMAGAYISNGKRRARV
jgi:hypothetical protein